MWAASVVENKGRCYFSFSANDIKSDYESGGTGVALGDHSQGLDRELLAKSLVGTSTPVRSRSTTVFSRMTTAAGT